VNKMDKKLDVMYELCEYIEHELEALNEKLRANGGQMGDRELEWLKNLTESKVNLMCAIEKLEEKEGHSGTHMGGTMSYRSRERSNRSMDNMSRRSGARRDSMGRYTRDDAREDFIYEVEELMNRAPDEHTRMKFERMLNEMR
jgi:hypothetical protein